MGKLNLPDFPDDGIVRKYTAAPAKATDSAIEERLNCLKYGDTDAKKFMMRDQVRVKNPDGIVQFKTTRKS